METTIGDILGIRRPSKLSDLSGPPVLGVGPIPQDKTGRCFLQAVPVTLSRCAAGKKELNVTRAWIIQMRSCWVVMHTVLLSSSLLKPFLR